MLPFCRKFVVGRENGLVLKAVKKIRIMWPRPQIQQYRSTGFMDCPPFPHNNFFQSPHSRLGPCFQSFSQPFSEIPLDQPATPVNCGELRVSDAGKVVEIAGLVHDIRGGRFLVLKDDAGFTQCVAPDERHGLQKRIENMPVGSYVVCRGQVVERPNENKVLSKPTGSIEVIIEEFITVQAKRKCDDRDSKHTKKSKSKPLLTTEEAIRAKNSAIRSYFLARSHRCSDICNELVGRELTLCGWISVKRNFNFLGFKDGSGELQMVTGDNSKGMPWRLHDFEKETVVFVKGVLANRPVGKENMRVSNGKFELIISEMKPLTEHSPPVILSESSSGALDDNSTISSQPPAPQLPPQGRREPCLNEYTWRTHTCGELRPGHVGQSVVLVGWVEFIRLTKFLLLRDSYGTTQILINNSDDNFHKMMGELDLESVVKVTGTVTARPDSQIKNDILTGEIEVLASSVTILNKAEDLPFQLRDFKKVHEPLRMTYRYIDLRSKEMQRNLRLRSTVLMKMREFLVNHSGFVEVETPTLFKKTPGGAREFIVPTHTVNHFYSLVQSPQQLKQMLMVGAVDRYFQIARCYRDESTRPDRQPEFTQLDIELSFCTQENVIRLVEDLLQYCWPEPKRFSTPFLQMTYEQAMEIYGCDKPDLRYDWEIKNFTTAFLNGYTETSKLNVKQNIEQNSDRFAAHSFVMKSAKNGFSSSSKSKFESELKSLFPQVKVITTTVHRVDQARDDLNKLFGENIANSIMSGSQVNASDCIITSFGPINQVRQCMGKARVLGADILEGNGLKIRNHGFQKFIWITDFPLFNENDAGQLESNHHPFTAPKLEMEGELFTQPRKILGQHYDLVLNGCEIAGGSIRIHDGAVQEKVLTDILKIDVEPLKHLLNALRSGAPPHGGIAVGLDRLIAIMAGTNSIRDVIAFPKSTDGKDPLSGAPSHVSSEELLYYHLTRTVDPSTKQD